MLLQSRPVRFLITRVARAYGFLDPVAVLARLRGFSQPSEVAEPIELLRAGMLFHARGLVNTKAIQHNLDWVWPYWVERQFDPADRAFIPRAFSFSHINLTHRNWTAVGLPDVPYYPIVDPRGLVTPLFDGWSLDFWWVPASGSVLFPSQLDVFEQRLELEENLHVRSVARGAGHCELATDVSLQLRDAQPSCTIHVRAQAAAPGALAVALRPYNPEGVSAVGDIEVHPDRRGWRVNHQHAVHFDQTPARHQLSTYREGDVSLRLAETGDGPTRVHCAAGMATAVALFPAAPGAVRVTVPIADELAPARRLVFRGTAGWKQALAPLARLRIADPLAQRLYDLAAANIVLHAPEEVYPGPYTYKRFWFRDAVFILNALLSLGDIDRTRRAVGRFVPRQRRDGYFLSQEGEWDSNGEVLWFYDRFARLTGEPLPHEWLQAIARGARWLRRKRLPAGSGRLEAGLLPAGFSAEHLGPNDYYYWDDFWGAAGLCAASELLREFDAKEAEACEREAAEFMTAIIRSYPDGPHRRFPGAIPASPHRRMDAGAVGSLVADYPLQLFPPGDRGILRTADYLTEHCLHAGGFFQNMIHSGINAYLTLHLAQVRLRAGEAPAAWRLMDAVAALASPTGQWPEAIHPATGGGCMGDGQHIWAAAEWLMMIRNCFVREEDASLVLGAGLRPEWLGATGASFGPTLTPYGPVRLHAQPARGGIELHVEAAWRGDPCHREIRVPGTTPLSVPAHDRREHFFLNTTP